MSESTRPEGRRESIFLPVSDVFGSFKVGFHISQLNKRSLNSLYYNFMFIFFYVYSLVNVMYFVKHE